MTFLYEVQHVTCYNCMVIRRGYWPAKMLIITPRSSGMLYLICKRAKPVRRSSPIVVYIEKILRAGGGGFPGNGKPFWLHPCGVRIWRAGDSQMGA